MDFSVLIAAVTAAAGALAAAVVALLSATRMRGVAQRAARPSLEDRLADLGSTMAASARLLEEVQAEINARIQLADRARRDAEEAHDLAQLSEAQRVALARLVGTEVQTEINRSSRRAFWQSFAVNFLFFLLGVGVTLFADVFLRL